MANDMGAALNALKGILGDGAEEKIKAVMSSLSDGNASEEQEKTQVAPMENAQNVQPSGGIDAKTLEYIMRMKGIVEEMSQGGDNRSNLLLSLRPYMREQRQHSIDSALKLMTLTKLSGVFGKL